MSNVEYRITNVECRIKIAAIGKNIHNYQLSIIRYSLFVIHFLCREGRGGHGDFLEVDHLCCVLMPCLVVACPR